MKKSIKLVVSIGLVMALVGSLPYQLFHQVRD